MFIDGSADFPEWRRWAAFGFESIGNLESRPLLREARGPAFASLVSDYFMHNLVTNDILNDFDLIRDDDGRLRRRRTRGLLFAR